MERQGSALSIRFDDKVYAAYIRQAENCGVAHTDADTRGIKPWLWVKIHSELGGEFPSLAPRRAPLPLALQYWLLARRVLHVKCIPGAIVREDEVTHARCLPPRYPVLAQIPILREPPGAPGGRRGGVEQEHGLVRILVRTGPNDVQIP